MRLKKLLSVLLTTAVTFTSVSFQGIEMVSAYADSSNEVVIDEIYDATTSEVEAEELDVKDEIVDLIEAEDAESEELTDEVIVDFEEPEIEFSEEVLCTDDNQESLVSTKDAKVVKEVNTTPYWYRYNRKTIEREYALTAEEGGGYTLTIYGDGTFDGFLSNDINAIYKAMSKNREERDRFNGQLSKVVIADRVKYIGSNAFTKCKKITSIEMPDSVELLKNRSLSGLTEIKSIEIPKNCTTIEDNVFTKNTALEKIIIPAKCISFGRNSFSGCNNIRQIYFMGDKIKSVKNGTFYNLSASKKTTDPVVFYNAPSAVKNYLEKNKFRFKKREVKCVDISSVELKDITVAYDREYQSPGFVDDDILNVFAYGDVNYSDDSKLENIEYKQFLNDEYKIYKNGISDNRIVNGLNEFIVKVSQNSIEKEGGFSVKGKAFESKEYCGIEATYIGDDCKYAINDTIDRNDLVVIPKYIEKFVDGDVNYSYIAKYPKLDNDAYTINTNFNFYEDVSGYMAFTADNSSTALTLKKRVSYSEDGIYGKDDALISGWTDSSIIFSEDECEVSVPNRKLNYTGSPLEPSFSVTYLVEKEMPEDYDGDTQYIKTKLTAGVDYRYEYIDNVNVSPAEVYYEDSDDDGNPKGKPTYDYSSCAPEIRIQFMGDYVGYVSTKFSIERKPFNKLKVGATPVVKYTGSDLKEAIEDKLVLMDGNMKVDKLNYEVKFEDDAIIGNPSEDTKIDISIYPNDVDGNYAPKFDKDECIVPIKTTALILNKDSTAQDLSEVDCRVEFTNPKPLKYNGKVQKPKFNVFIGETKVNPKNYTAVYRDNLHAGNAYVEIYGKKDFYGTISGNFTIGKKAFNSVKLPKKVNVLWSNHIDDFVPTLKDGKKNLVYGEDFDVIPVAGRNTEFGSKKTFDYKIKIKPMGDYEGEEREIKLVVSKRKLNTKKIEITCDIGDTYIIGEGEYKGEARPLVEIWYGGTKLADGVDYDISYSNNKKAGKKGTIKITGKGYYTGTKTLKFMVLSDE